MDPDLPIKDFASTVRDLIVRASRSTSAYPGPARQRGPSHAVQPATALQSQHSLFSCEPETAVQPTLTRRDI